MKITKIVKTISRTINLQNFNSLRVENGVEVTLDETDAVADAEKSAYEEVRRAIANDLRRIKEERNKKSEETSE